MSESDQPKRRAIFTGLILGAMLFSSAVYAADTSYFYCRRIQGNPHTDFALAVTGNKIDLQPQASQESPGTRIYHGQVMATTPSGNILVDFNTSSMTQFLTSFPKAIFTPSIFQKGTSGYARLYTGGGNRSSDSMFACEVKKIFY